MASKMESEHIFFNSMEKHAGGAGGRVDGGREFVPPTNTTETSLARSRKNGENCAENVLQNRTYIRTYSITTSSNRASILSRLKVFFAVCIYRALYADNMFKNIAALGTKKTFACLSTQKFCCCYSFKNGPTPCEHG